MQHFNLRFGDVGLHKVGVQLHGLNFICGLGGVEGETVARCFGQLFSTK